MAAGPPAAGPLVRPVLQANWPASMAPLQPPRAQAREKGGTGGVAPNMSHHRGVAPAQMVSGNSRIRRQLARGVTVGGQQLT
eukprot:350755-Chlamydomonas_euryale.AAC.2